VPLPFLNACSGHVLAQAAFFDKGILQMAELSGDRDRRARC